MKDVDGNPIQAHGAGMFYENGTYYWYGENVPVSSECILTLPNDEKYELESGEHHIKCKI